MSTDVKLINNDYDLTDNKLTLHTENSQIVSQRIKIASQLGQGELFNNVLEGIPINLSSKIRDDGSFVREYMMDYLSGIEGVNEVVRFQSKLNNKTRVLEVSVAVRTDTGEIVEVDTGE